MLITIGFSFAVSADVNRDEEIQGLLDRVSADLMDTGSLELGNSSLAAPKKISFDIKGMDVVDVIKMIATEGGLNVVIGRNVTGRVTMFLKDVDLWDALEIILAANSLAYVQRGKVLNIMTDRDYEADTGTKFKDKRELTMIKLKYAKAAVVSKAIAQLKSNIGKVVVDDSINAIIILDTPESVRQIESMARQMDKTVVTEIFELNYAKADEVSPAVKEMLTKDVGTISVDTRTNKMIVTDYPLKIDEVKNLIVAFDEKTPQVLIDAQIIEIRPSDKFEMGVDWDSWIEKNLRLAGSFLIPTGTGNKLTAGLTAVTEAGEYSFILDALRTIGETRILSSPRIMAINNEEAKILVGEKDAYITSDISQSGTGTTIESQSVNFVDVGVKLYVTPTINSDGFITMKIKPEVSSAERQIIQSGDKSYEIPIVSTSQAETQVILKDGVTIMIAGLRKDQTTKVHKRIPLLGSIPILGFLFRSVSDNLQKTELVIFLTPHIVSGEYPLGYTSITDDDFVLDAQSSAILGAKDIEIK